MSNGSQAIGTTAKLGAGARVLVGALGTVLKVRLPQRKTDGRPEVEHVPRRSFLDRMRKVPRLPVLLALALAGGLAVVLVGTVLAAGQTFTVNSTVDAIDSDPADNVCDSDASTEGQQCTLRAAVQQANATGGSDTIAFDLSTSDPGYNSTTGVFTIAPTSSLPTITTAVNIDGYSQSGASENTLAQGNNAKLMIELSGASAPAGVDGLKITAADSTVRGLVINGFREIGPGGSGIDIRGAGATGNKVEGNLLGTNPAGTASGGGGNARGVVVGEGASGNFVGGTGPGARNLLSGNRLTGISIAGGASNNFVQNNYVGADAAGTAPLRNGFYGVEIFAGASAENVVGGADANERNVISGNGLSGVRIDGSGASENKVQGNYLGTDASGTQKLPNLQDGVRIEGGSPNNFVGADGDGTGDAGERNVISGNNANSVAITSNASSNKVQGNYVGTDATGTEDLGNSQSGVWVDRSPNNTIGGTTEGARNVISGNVLDGVTLSFAGDNKVQGNYVGTDVGGTADLGNSRAGVNIGGPNNTIGGAVTQTSNPRNIISGNDLSGVFIGEASGNKVQGNYVGTDKNGTAKLGNSVDGVTIINSTGNFVGGTTDNPCSVPCNVISDNQNAGIQIQASGASNNSVRGNYIGTDVSGTADLGNRLYGVAISQSSGNLVGGTTTEARNLISGNGNGGLTSGGVFIAGSVASGNKVEGNYVGAKANGTEALGNSPNGVYVGGSNNSVGGTTAGAGNAVAFNDGDGVRVQSSVGNAILSNSIFSNGGTSTTGLGIDLDPDGVTPNDDKDPDTGSNNLQNFPVLTKANSSDGTTKIEGTLDSTPSKTFTVQFFSSPEKDPSGNGEGKTYLGQKTDVTTDSSGNASFTFDTSDAPLREFVSATATSSGNDTSEFSGAVEVVPGNTAPVADDQPDVTTNEDTPELITLTGADEDGAALTYEIATLPTNGKLYEGDSTDAADDITSANTTLSGNQVTYKPNADYSGSDSFEFLANDGTEDSNEATVTIDVTAVNDAPEISLPGGPLAYTENDPPEIIDPGATAEDPDSANFDTGALTVDFSAGGTADDRLEIRNEGNGSGQIGVSGSEVTYGGATIGAFAGGSGTMPLVVTFNANSSPEAAQALMRNITYRNVSENPSEAARTVRFVLADGDGGTSNEATKTINVAAANDTPDAMDDTSAVDEGGAPISIDVLANDKDPDGDTLIIESNTQPPIGEGSVRCSEEECTFTPDADFNGRTTFEYTIDDGNGGADTAIVTITVSGTNDAPTTKDDAANTDEDTPVDVDVLANDTDPEGDQLAITEFSQPENSQVTRGPNGKLTYTPNKDFEGADSFTYNASDGAANSSTAKVIIMVKAVNDAPVATDDTATTDEDTPKDIDVLSNDSDPDSDALSVTEFIQPANGQVTKNANGTLRYVPKKDFNGTDTFDYTVSDGKGGADTAKVTITVTPVEDCTIIGTEGKDFLQDTPGDDVICGKGGDDVIIATKGGNDVIYGDGGNDSVLGTKGSTTLKGGEGDDILVKQDKVSGNDTLDGEAGNDFCLADKGDKLTNCERGSTSSLSTQERERFNTAKEKATSAKS